MQSDDLKIITISLNTTEATDKLKSLRADLETVKKARRDAFERADASAIQQLTKETKRLEREISNASTSAQRVDRVLKNLSAATPRELTATIRQLNKELNSGAVERNSAQWHAYQRAIAEAKGELEKIKQQQRAFDESVKNSGFVARARQWGDALSRFHQVYTRVVGFAKSAVDEYAKIEAAQRSVTKYTGLAADQVQQLNKEFDQLNTATPREKLNALAADAGRLGLSARQDVLDFVAAANTINVALGEDLGEGAVTQIAKLSDIFGTTAQRGLKEGMLSTASAINELAQSSSASEGYLAEFAGRLGSVAATAGMTQADVLALGSVLSQGAVNCEVAATATSRLIQKIYAEPAKIATTMGIDVQHFTELLRTDATAALMEFLKAAQGTGGFEKLSPILKDLSIQGAGVSQVVATLSGNLSNLRATQLQAADAFAAATSATNEQAVAEQSVQARLARTEQAAADLRAQLGAALLPAFESVTRGGISLSSVLVRIVSFLADNATTVIAVAAAWALATAAVKAHVLVTKTFELATKAAAAAQALFNAVATKNPYAAIATVLVSVVAGVIAYKNEIFGTTKALTDQERATRAVAEAENEAAHAAAAEKNKIQTLYAAVKDATLSLRERQSALTELQKLVPAYHGALTKEGKLLNDNSDAITKQIQLLYAQAKARAYSARLEKVYDQRIDVDKAEHDERVKAERASQRAAALKVNADREGQYKTYDAGRSHVTIQTQAYTAYVAALDAAKEAEEAHAEAQKAKNAVIAEQTALQKAAASAERERLQVESQSTATSSSTGTGTSGSTGGGRSTSSPRAKQSTRPAPDFTAALLIQRERAAYALGLQSYDEYAAALAAAAADLEQQLTQAKKEGNAKRIDETRAALTTLRGEMDKETAYSVRQIEVEKKEEQAALKRKYAQGAITRDQYQQQLTVIDLRALRRRLKLEEQFGTPESQRTARLAYEDAVNTDLIARRERAMQLINEMRANLTREGTAGVEQIELESAARICQTIGLTAEQTAGILADLKRRQAEAVNNLGGANNAAPAGGASPAGAPTDLDTPQLANDPLTSSILAAARAFTALDQKIKDGNATWADYASAATSALGVVSGITSSVTALFEAKQQRESNAIERKYAKLKKEANGNAEREQELDRQKAKEQAALKARYAKKEAKVQIAQAVANTAFNAILAFQSMAKIPVVGPALAAAAAAAALASGAIQIAAIKEQAAAAADFGGEYFEGGWTSDPDGPDQRYRAKLAILHGNEYVIPARGIDNPAVRALADRLEQARRTNTLATITAAQLTAAASYGASRTAAPASQSRVGASSKQLAPTREETITDPAATSHEQTAALLQTLTDLNTTLSSGITSRIYLGGQDGLAANLRRYNAATQ